MGGEWKYMRYFVPYSDDHPATVEIKGHKLLVVGVEESDIAEGLEAVGGDAVHEIIAQTDEDQNQALTDLARTIGGGVVLTPAGVGVMTMLQNLEQELPWVH